MTTQSFSYTGAAQTWTVPANVYSVTMELWGAQGGAGEGNSGTPNGGLGGYIKATVTVTPGEVLQVRVGGQGVAGSSTAAGGYNGGGQGGRYTCDGGGGGGATDVRRGAYALADRLVIAGGGGGGGGDSNLTNLGGAGGGGGYTTGVDGTAGTVGGHPGLKGTASAGGAAGGGVHACGSGGPATAGTLGSGGTADDGINACLDVGGGGGGGGYYGGGGAGRTAGSKADGGGGGSSAVLVGSYVTSTNSTKTGNGAVTFTYTAATAGTILSDVPYLEGNDRNQIIACVLDGTTAGPAFVYWCPAPAVWGEALAADPTDYPTIFALNELSEAINANLELKPWDAPEGFEALITEVQVDYVVRPNSMSTYDGGVGSSTCGFTGYVEGWGIHGVVATGTDSLTTQVTVSSDFALALTAASMSGDPWPHRRTARLPVRLAQSVRGVRVGLKTVQFVEILAVEVIGTLVPLRGT